MTSLKGKSSSKLQIASHGKRLIAFIIDFAIALLLVNTLARFSYEEHWDLHLPAPESWVSLIPFYGAILFLMIMKDGLKGVSPGKFILGIAVRPLEDLSKPPVIKKVLLRNLPLLIFPIEGVLLFMDSHGRRLGDTWANTVVIENPKAARFIVRLMATNIIFIGYFFSAFFIQPLVMKKTAAYQTAVAYLQTHSMVIEQLGAIDECESPEMDLNIDDVGGRALLRIHCIGAKHSAHVQVHLHLTSPQRTWQAERLEVEE